MKTCCNSELPVKELRQMVVKLKNRENRTELFYKLAVLGGILVLVCVAVAAVKHLLKSRCADDDDWDIDYECDENGCYYTDDDDFESEE